VLNQDKAVESICAATGEVFSTMLCLDVKSSPAYLEPNASGNTDGIVALIGLAGEWVGTGVLHCDGNLGRKLFAAMLGEAEPPDEAVTEDVLDAIAEIANMIIGNVKNALEETVGPLGMSTPTVVFGRNFTTRSTGTDQWVVVPFSCDGLKMEVKLCLSPERAQPGRHGFALTRLGSS
jgi:chemotaxis protein CheX